MHLMSIKVNNAKVIYNLREKIHIINDALERKHVYTFFFLQYYEYILHIEGGGRYL